MEESASTWEEIADIAVVVVAAAAAKTFVALNDEVECRQVECLCQPGTAVITATDAVGNFDR